MDNRIMYDCERKIVGLIDAWANIRPERMSGISDKDEFVKRVLMLVMETAYRFNQEMIKEIQGWDPPDVFLDKSETEE